MAAAHSIHGEGTPETHQWLKTHEQWLYQGQSRRIADRLLDSAQTYPDATKSLADEAGYFMKHHRRMQNMRLREDGWAIGSGMVESGIKQYKDRFYGVGMRWSREGAENLIPIRTAILSDGETGLLVEQRDAAALADAIEQVLSDPALAHKLDHNGYHYANQHFSWESVEAETLAMYGL